MINIIYIFILSFISQTIIAQSEITLENLWQNYSYNVKSVPGFNFMNDGRHYTRLEKNSINKYDLISGEKVSTTMDPKSLQDFGQTISSYKYNQNETKIVLESETKSIYRRSSEAYFYVYDVATSSVKKIHDSKIMYATLNPKSDKVAYVLDNDIYLYDLNTNQTTQVTKDGKKNNIINGSADWVYEEEFSMSQAFYWSPDGSNIAFMRFNESDVPEFTMTLFNDGMYPEYETFKYPKVGEKNAIVSAHIYNVDSKKTKELQMGEMNDIYIPRIKWTNGDNELVVFKLNRHQNHLQLLLFNSKSEKPKILLDEKNTYFVVITDDLTFLKDKKHFIWSSEKGGYNQIYLYNMDGQELHNLTPGSYDVKTIYGVDEKKGVVYYSSAEVSPIETYIYSIDLKGKNKKQITPQKGTNNAQFSSTYDYYILNHSSAISPPNYTVYNSKYEKVREIENNEKFANHLIDYGLNPIEFFKFKTSENVELNGYMIKPTNFNEKRKYPVFMTQYSGPGSQSVVNKWSGNNYWWYQMLAQNGYLVVCVDPRGTGGRGEEFKKMTYLQMGKYETIDQIEAAKYIATLPFTDANRIGIFGWSYGGFMSSLCIAKGANIFKSAIAVAPVTNWKWYDSVYTERFMRTYLENESGYKDNSPVYFADQIKGNYLLVHGLADDNVHWQNSAEMTMALIKANKQFDTYVYPNRNHGIIGNNARIHLYTKMTNFIYEKL